MAPGSRPRDERARDLGRARTLAHDHCDCACPLEKRAWVLHSAQCNLLTRVALIAFARERYRVKRIRDATRLRTTRDHRPLYAAVPCPTCGARRRRHCRSRRTGRWTQPHRARVLAAGGAAEPRSTPMIDEVWT